MTASLAALLAEARFPLFAIHPRHWAGLTFLGDVGRRGAPEPWVTDVHVVSLDEVDAPSRAAAVGSVDPALLADASAPVDPVELHLTPFVSRLDPGWITARMKRRRSEPFPRSDFDARQVVSTIAGERVGVEILRHTELPLELARAVVRGGTTAVGVAAWRTPALDLLPLVEPVTPELARALDDAASQPYPPPEWGTPPA